MSDESCRNSIMVIGEIYNYLESWNAFLYYIDFKTQSDTEVF